MYLTYYGHSFLEIETGNTRIFIDPFITGNSHITKPLEYFFERKPTHIILTHWHLDHIGNAPEIAKVCDSQIVTSFEIVHYVQHKYGVTNTTPWALWGSLKFADFTVKFVPALHGTGLGEAGSGFTCHPMGVVVRAEGKNIYHAGDTALTYDMKLLGEYDSIDVAFLPIGDTYTMGIDDAVIATSFVNPKKVVPIHYDTFPPIKVDVDDFLTKVGENGFLLKAGEGMEV